MSELMKPRAKGRPIAVLVLVIALAATVFGVWREHEIARRDQVIHWQSAYARLEPILFPLIAQRFENLHDQAKNALRRDNYSENAWKEFLATSEWQQRFPGMVELGYAELAADQCVVKYVASRSSTPLHPPGADLNGTSAIREAVQKSADAGYGIGSRATRIGTDGGGGPVVVVGIMPIPIRNARPASPAENRANLRGIVFFMLDQAEYSQQAQSRLKSLPFDLRLLGADEPAPPRTPTQRPFTNAAASGEWRFVATIKAPPSNAAQWIVLGGGTALSLLLFRLFSAQARLRQEAESANERILSRDTEILELNRGLEEKIAARTEQLKAALAEEKELNRLKGNFISMVTHEIRTPLALILGSSEILSRYLDRLAPEKRTEHLRTIDSAVQRMNALIADVLLFSRAESGRIEFNPVSTDLKDFCAQLVDEILSATNRRCPIELSLAGISEPARCDTTLLRHIFANLLTNAAKYSVPGMAVKFAISRAGDDAVFVVQDCGMGIPEADRKRLFTPFYRGKNAATIPGTGLGLVIVRHCTERHGGKIELESAENLGTTVTVRLPLFAPAKAGVNGPLVAAPPALQPVNN